MADTTRFEHQAFLSSHLDEIASEITNNFEFIKTIDTSNKSLSECFALLTGKTEIFPFTKLKSHQYSALIPKVRIFRVDSDGAEYEFKFVKDTKLNEVNILGENLIRDNGAGIKSINWTLAGTNPVTAEKNIECSIEFFFNSINAFSGGSYDKMLEFWKSGAIDFKGSGFDEGTTTRNYWALLFHPSLSPDKYESPKFRIKAVIGWEDVDPNLKNDLFGSYKEIQEDLESSNLVMYLNLVKHDFKFNEDGSIVINANYIGSIENALFNYKYDLFRGLKSQLNKLNSKITITKKELVGGRTLVGAAFTGLGREVENEYTVDITAQENKLKLLKSLQQGNSGTYSTQGCDTQQIELYNKLKALPPEAYNDIIQKNEEELKRQKDLLEEEETKIKNNFYGSLINRLIGDDKGKSNLYSISIDEQGVRDWVNWKDRVSENSDGTPVSGSSISSVKPPSIKSSITSPNNSSNKDAKLDLESTVSSTSDGKWEKFTSEQKDKEANIETQTIYYTTVGKLIDAAHKVIYYGTVKDVSADDGGPLEEADQKQFKKNNIVFSSFDGDSKLSIASVPISYNNLLEFFIEKIYKPQKKEYSLYQFIKDIITAVVEPALNNRDINNNEINKYSNTSLATNIITLKGEPNKDPLQSYISKGINPTINLSGVTKKSFKKYYPSYNPGNNNYYFYYFIYDKYLKDFDGKGDVDQDAKRGIYHYTVAQDYGLIKSINFKKNDQPYLREAKSVGKKTIFLGQFRDIYQADVSMVGNNIYTPGMILLLKPSVEFGNVIGSSDAASPSFSQITGVGGYYSVIKVSNTISDSGYTTSLDCLFHSNEPKKKREEKEASCSEEMLDLLGNPELEEILKEVKKEVVEEGAKAAAWQAAEQAYEENMDTVKSSTGIIKPLVVALATPAAVLGAALGAYFGTDTLEQAQVALKKQKEEDEEH